MTELKTASGKPSRFEYKCNLCSRLFNQKSKLSRHLASKTPCHEKRDLSWLKAQYDSGSIDKLIDVFDNDEAALKKQIGNLTSDSTVAELDEVRKSIQRLRGKKNSVVAYVRVKTHENPQLELESEILKLDHRIEELVRKYKLLLIV